MKESSPTQFWVLPLLAAALCLLNVPHASAQANAAGKGAVIIISVEGDVKIKVNATGAFLPQDSVAAGKSFQDGHAVITGDAGKAVLLLSNGSLTTVFPKSELSVQKFTQVPIEESDAKVSEIETEPSQSTTNLQLGYGNMFFKVKKLNAGSAFAIDSPVGSAGIRGTAGQMNVQVDPGTGNYSGGVDMLEGSVEYTDPSGETAPVNAGQGTRVVATPQGQQVGETQQVDVPEETTETMQQLDNETQAAVEDVTVDDVTDAVENATQSPADEPSEPVQPEEPTDPTEPTEPESPAEEPATEPSSSATEDVILESSERISSEAPSESDQRVNTIRAGTVENVQDAAELTQEEAEELVQDQTGDDPDPSDPDLPDPGDTDPPTDPTDPYPGDDHADDLLNEAANLFNSIFTNGNITTGSLDTGKIYDRARLASNEFKIRMISVWASYSGNEAIGSAIEDSVTASSINESNGFIGRLTEVLSSSRNLDILGTRAKEIGDIFKLGTDDFEAYAGNDVTVEAGSQVDLSPHGTKIFAIVAADDLHIAGDVSFSDRSSTWDKEALAIGAVEHLTIASGSTIEYKGNYLGLGTQEDISIEQVTIKAGSGVGIGSLGNVSIKGSAFEVTNSAGGFGFFADNQIDLEDLTFAGNVEYIYMEARTINLSHIDFPAGSSVDLLSELGPIGGKYPNFGSSLPGRVNFIEGVSYGGTENLMHDQPSFDQFGDNIHIKEF